MASVPFTRRRPLNGHFSALNPIHGNTLKTTSHLK